jgi:hypothetical protein
MRKTNNINLALGGLGPAALGAGAAMVGGEMLAVPMILAGANNLRRLGARAIGMGTGTGQEAYKINPIDLLNLKVKNTKQAGKEQAQVLDYIDAAKERSPLPTPAPKAPDTLTPQFAAAGGGAIPGAQATNIKMRSPTQAQQISAGMSAQAGPSATQIRDYDAAMMGAKDYRNALAGREAEIAMDLANMDLQPALNALNEPGARQGPMMEEALRNDTRYQEIAGRGVIPRYKDQEPSNFIGEGMFGKVYEVAPGVVQKQVPAVVEFGMGSESDPMRGLKAGGGHLYGPAQHIAEAKNQAVLGEYGIAPRVFNVDIDQNNKVGSLPGVNIDMQDIRNNYIMGEAYDEGLRDAIQDGRPKDRRVAIEKAQRRMIAQQKQEAQAALLGIDLQDRHSGNYAVHEMMGRPIQLDIGFAGNVTGFERDVALANRSVRGMAEAGLSEEAEILDGLFREAAQRNDPEAFHDLAQQGVSRLMKLKGGAKDYYRVNENA